MLKQVSTINDEARIRLLDECQILEVGSGLMSSAEKERTKVGQERGRRQSEVENLDLPGTADLTRPVVSKAFTTQSVLKCQLHFKAAERSRPAQEKV